MRRTLVILGILVLTLLAVGFVVLTSASGASGIRLHGGNRYYFAVQQAKWLGIALFAFAAAALVDYRTWRDRPWLTVALYIAVCALLFLALFSRKINGSHRWLQMGPLRLQPGEFAKLLAVIATAVWADRAGWRIELFWKGACLACLLLGIPVVLTLAEPDFGTAMVVAATGGSLLFLAGMKIVHCAILGTVGLAGVGALLAANTNRMYRLMAYFSRSAGAAGADDANHQLNQSLVAFSNGIRSDLPPWWDHSSVSSVWNALTGVGFTESMQKHYYLPEAHTDFIFAIGAEELGLFFSMGMLLLYSALFACGMAISARAPDRFGRFLAFGAAFLIFFQVLFNIGVVTGCLPPKGLALPFVSYGGTNLLVSAAAIGLLVNVGRRIDLPKRRSKSRIPRVVLANRK